MDLNLTTLLVAVLGAGGIGSVLREIFTGVGRLSRGVKLRESDRRDDLNARAIDAERRADKAEARAEREARNRWALEEYAARIRRALIEQGREAMLPPAPAIDEGTMTGQEFQEIRTRRQALDQERS